MNCQMGLSNSKLPFDLHLVLMESTRTKLKTYLSPFFKIRYKLGYVRCVSAPFLRIIRLCVAVKCCSPIFLMELDSQLDIIQLKLPIRQNGNEIENYCKQNRNFWCCLYVTSVQMEVIFCFNAFLVCILQKLKKKGSGGGVR